MAWHEEWIDFSWRTHRNAAIGCSYSVRVLLIICRFNPVVQCELKCHISFEILFLFIKGNSMVNQGCEMAGYAEKTPDLATSLSDIAGYYIILILWKLNRTRRKWIEKPDPSVCACACPSVWTYLCVYHIVYDLIFSRDRRWEHWNGVYKRFSWEMVSILLKKGSG